MDIRPQSHEIIRTWAFYTIVKALLHEDVRTGGLAGEIAAIINEEAFDDLDGPIVRIAALDTPVPFSPPQEEHFLPQLRDVVEKACWLNAY